MSATIGNLHEIGQFLNAEMYTKDFRPVELIEYIKCDNKVFKINRDETGSCTFTLERLLNYHVCVLCLKCF